MVDVPQVLAIMKICVVIPSYNVAQTIGGIVKEITAQSIDTVVIDDGSSDSTLEETDRFAAVVLRNERNLGKGASLKKGFAYCLQNGYEVVIAMDGDGQHSPSEIRSFLDALKLNPQADMIVGNRMHCPQDMPCIRRLTNKIMSGLISYLCKQDIPDSQNGFRLIKSAVLKDLELKSNRFEIESEMIVACARKGAKIISIPVCSVYRNIPSQINPILDTVRFIKFILPYLIRRKPGLK
jgi:glycosyltransferase involved in cell wall biosynthesis